MAEIKPGLTFKYLSAIAIKFVTKGLVELNILQGGLQTLIENNAYKAYYMYGLGHWLGL